MTSWQELRLGEVIELKRGYDLPNQARRAGAIPVVSSSGPSGFHDEAKVKAPGVVTGRYGTLGEIFYVVQDYWPLNTTLYVRDFKGNDPRFISYFLRSVDLLSCSDKAAVPGLNRNHLHELTVRLPPPSEQRAIARILGALDDKIELNRRTNETLEAMARAIFQSWFVDFDPARAKMEGRQPEGMDAETAKLFPSSFDSIGAPSGWSKSTIGELSERVAMGPFGSSIKVSTFVEKGVPVISGHHLHRPLVSDRDFRFLSEEHANQLRNANVGPGDLIFTHAGTIGQVSLMPYETTYERYVISQRQFYIRPDAQRLSGEWLMCHFRSAAGQHALLANASSTGVPSLAQPVTYVRGLRVVAPPPDIDRAFTAAVRPWLRAGLLLDAESRCLSAMRDTLLPKLLSGELRVPDAERAVANAF